MHPIIFIEELTKRYQISAYKENFGLRDAITSSFRNIFSTRRKNSTTFTALDKISLEIKRGEKLGIIGHNGAGKTTLLKIISRIVPPSEGRVILEGRVASLLEVGTGFHPELTGRENIFLNGSILGMKKREIAEKLDEIIDFSGVRDFIDVPLKKYSSGMQLRLAFSVAAHLDADVVLIDEVLAVGDLEFQKKCLGKMEEMNRQAGRTILFVSHSMAAIRQLCTSAIVLQKGKLQYRGNPSDAIDLYSQAALYQSAQNDQNIFDLSGHPNKIMKGEGILSAKMLVDDVPNDTFLPGHDLTIEVDYKLEQPLFNAEVGIVIKDSEDRPLIGLNNKHLGKQIQLRTGIPSRVRIKIPALNIWKPGKYRVDLFFGDPHHFYECLYHAFEFNVPEDDVYRSGVLPDPSWNSIYIRNIDITAE